MMTMPVAAITRPSVGPRIIVDLHERDAGIMRLLEGEKDLSLAEIRLAVGDFVVNHSIGIERKTDTDFVQSLIRGRLFDQIARLVNTYERAALFIEGGHVFETGFFVHENALRGALVSLAFRFQIPILYPRDRTETAAMLTHCARQDWWSSCRPRTRFGSASRTVARRQVYLLKGLSRVGDVLGLSLLRRFKTPARVFSATEGELMGVEGVGRTIARGIRGLLDAPFDED